AFGAGATTGTMIARAHHAKANTVVTQGADMLARELDTAEGLAPLFNGVSRDNCHKAGGMGSVPTTFVTRVALITTAGFAAPGSGRCSDDVDRRVSQRDRSSGTVRGDAVIDRRGSVRVRRLCRLPPSVLSHSRQHGRVCRRSDSHGVSLFGSSAPRHGAWTR